MLDATVLPLGDTGAVLRPLRTDDAAAYAEGAGDVSVRQYGHLPEPEYTEASVRVLIDGEIREGLDRGDLAVLAIGDPVTDDFAGSLVLFGVADGSAEVGFWVHPSHRGKGMAGAAVRLAEVFARRSGLSRLTARTVPGNLTSRQVLEAAGFRRGAEVVDVAPSGAAVVLVPYLREIGRDGRQGVARPGIA